MDSGAFPGDGYPRAAYHRNIQYAEPGGGRYVDAAPSDLAQNRDAEHPLCYNITVQQPAVNFTNWPGGTTTTQTEWERNALQLPLQIPLEHSVPEWCTTAWHHQVPTWG
jgi:hypothetical protein